ncbi:MAG: DUF7424 family protein [Limnochordia bacterium]|jgi:hypothetical protein
MQSKRLALLALLGALLLLTGCAGEFYNDLYVLDILDVANGEEEYLLTGGTVYIESPGEEYEPTLKSLLEQNFWEVENFRKGDGDYSSKVIADLKVPVLHFDTWLTEKWADETMAFLVMPMEGGLIAFGLMLNGERIDAMFASLAEETFFTLSIHEFSFNVKLHNDLRESIPVYFQGLYVNGTPVHYEELWELARRDTVDIKLGDVARDYAYEEGYVFLGVLEYWE